MGAGCAELRGVRVCRPGQELVLGVDETRGTLATALDGYIWMMAVERVREKNWVGKGKMGISRHGVMKRGGRRGRDRPRGQ